VQITDILRYKSIDTVWTIAPDATVTELLDSLAEHHIGALIVVESDRDVVRRLHDQGAAVLQRRVADIMTRDVVHCSPHDAVDSVATLMTERRIRHLPVLDGDALIGVVSIGDVVLSRMRELQKDRDQLEQYITG
jgi:CBS domain-containing protein